MLLFGLIVWVSAALSQFLGSLMVLVFLSGLWIVYICACFFEEKRVPSQNYRKEGRQQDYAPAMLENYI